VFQGISQKRFTGNRIVEHQEGSRLSMGQEEKEFDAYFFECSCFAEMSSARFACVSLVIG